MLNIWKMFTALYSASEGYYCDIFCAFAVLMLICLSMELVK